MLFCFHAAHDHPRLLTVYGQHGWWLRGAMRTIIAFTLIGLVFTGCSQQNPVFKSDLPIYENYPPTIDAVAAIGTLGMDGKCVVFTRSDGVIMIPLFRQGTTKKALEADLGLLSEPVAVTLSGYTVMNDLPPKLSRQLDMQGCDGIPIVFGEFVRRSALPPAPID